MWKILGTYLNHFSSAITKHSRLVWKYDSTFVLSKQIKHISKHPRITSCVDIVINNIYVHRILENRWERAYLDSKLSTSMGSEVSSTINIKQIQAYLQEESKSIEYQTITFRNNIREDIKNVGPPTMVLVDFA